MEMLIIKPLPSGAESDELSEDATKDSLAAHHALYPQIAGLDDGYGSSNSSPHSSGESIDECSLVTCTVEDGDFVV